VCTFLDKIVNCFTGNWNDPEYTNIHTEFFYWTPDLPEIVIKQSHMIRRWFESKPGTEAYFAMARGQYHIASSI
jgi:hypothetical protein